MKSKLFLCMTLSFLLFSLGIGRVVAQTGTTNAIIEMSQNCLLGGVKNKKWIKADIVGKPLKGAQKFSIYNLDGASSDLSVNKISKGGENEPCDDFWSFELEPKMERGIGISSPTWNVMPRQPRAIDLKDTTYVKVVRDILISKGIKKPEVKITQGYKIDLDGDGKDEVVIAANNLPEHLMPSVEAGQYSFLLVRKIIGGKVQNIMLGEEYYPRAKEGAIPSDNHISAIADLNGDGVMELVVYGGYYEGSGSSIIEIRGSKAVNVLDCACGV